MKRPRPSSRGDIADLDTLVPKIPRNWSTSAPWYLEVLALRDLTNLDPSGNDYIGTQIPMEAGITQPNHPANGVELVLRGQGISRPSRQWTTNTSFSGFDGTSVPAEQGNRKPRYLGGMG
jgi:hypothetical protein